MFTTDTKLVFDGRKEPLLKDEDILSCTGQSKNGLNSLPNSHYSLIQLIGTYAEANRRPFHDLKATTPMYRALICMANDLYMNEEIFEEALEAPFDNGNLRIQDFCFHGEISEWTRDIIYQNKIGYENHHRRMADKLASINPKIIKINEEITIPLNKLCTRKIREAEKSGYFLE